MFQLIAIVWLAALVWALVSGRAYSRGFVTREDAPVKYWTATGVYLVMAVVCFSIGPVR